MKRYKVNVSWSVDGSYYVEAENEKAAEEITYEMSLPEMGEYIDDSYRIDSVEEIE